MSATNLSQENPVSYSASIFTLKSAVFLYISNDKDVLKHSLKGNEFHIENSLLLFSNFQPKCCSESKHIFYVELFYLINGDIKFFIFTSCIFWHLKQDTKTFHSLFQQQRYWQLFFCYINKYFYSTILIDVSRPEMIMEFLIVINLKVHQDLRLI